LQARIPRPYFAYLGVVVLDRPQHLVGIEPLDRKRAIHGAKLDDRESIAMQKKYH
jgi:hypothetical protein